MGFNQNQIRGRSELHNNDIFDLMEKVANKDWNEKNDPVQKIGQ